VGCWLGYRWRRYCSHVRPSHIKGGSLRVFGLMFSIGSQWREKAAAFNVCFNIKICCQENPCVGCNTIPNQAISAEDSSAIPYCLGNDWKW
jgi:hypothetical protein